MRGLTREERRLLVEASLPMVPGEQVTPLESGIFDTLCARGLVRWVDVPGEDDGETAVITEDGLLALRVCTVSDGVGA